MTPGMRMGMDLLRLSPAELTQRLRTEADANPLLIVKDRPFPKSTFNVRDLATAPRTSLAAEVRLQIAAMSLSDDVRALAEFLTSALDSRGFLPQSRAEVAVESRFPLAVVDDALAALWACDPPGVGARNVYHSLTLQLVRQGMDLARAEHILDVYDPLMAGDIMGAQAQIGGSAIELEALAAQLRGLELEPARAFSAAPDLTLVPDILVEPAKGGDLTVKLSDSWMPEVSVDRILRVQGQEDATSRPFVEQRVRLAETLIRGIEFRKKTMVRLGQFLTATHRDFFGGQRSLPKPLNRSDAADALGVHASTIGRALRGRALEFDGQVFALNWFFPRRLEVSTDEEISTFAAQDLIRKLVSSEPNEAPLSDTELARLMRDAGVDIARRTIAKYRDAMNIPASHIRRRLALSAQGHMPKA